MVLNCLVFDTPPEFWDTQATKTNTSNDLAGALDGRYGLLGYGDWVCTHAIPNLPEHPFEPSCVKHDVGYGSLQKFVGTAGADDRDSVWNPRNKYLADIEFLDDLRKDATEWNDPPTSCLKFALVPKLYIACKIHKSRAGVLARAHIIHFGVASINSKFWAGWPIIVSDADKQDVLQNYRFVEQNTQ